MDASRFEIPKFSSARDYYLEEKGKVKSNLRVSDSTKEFLEELEDTSLLDLLDENFMIILGDNLIKLDFDFHVAIVTKELSEKQNLINSIYSGKNLDFYDFEEDLVSLLAENKKSSIYNNSENNRINTVYDPNAGTFGNSNNNSKSSTSRNIEGISFNGGSDFTYKIEAKHVYQKVAIYFRLFSEAKHMRSSFLSPLIWNSTNTTLIIWYDVKFKSKRSGSSEIIKKDVEDKFDNKIKVVYYENGRGLQKYSVKSQFYGEPGGNHGYSPTGDYWQFNLYEIKQGY